MMMVARKPMDRKTEFIFMSKALKKWQLCEKCKKTGVSACERCIGIEAECTKHRNAVIETMVPFVISIAKRFAENNNRTDVEDLVQVGLTKIVDNFWRFTLSTGNRALTYFGELAKRAIKDEIKFNRFMRLPGSYYTNETKLDAARKSSNIASLSDPSPNGYQGDLGSILPDKKSMPTDERVEASQQVKDLLSAMKKIPLRERQIIEMRMRGETLDVIGEKMRPKIGKERVRQLEARAKCRIKSIMTGHSPDKRVFRRTRKGEYRKVC